MRNAAADVLAPGDDSAGVHELRDYGHHAGRVHRRPADDSGAAWTKSAGNTAILWSITIWWPDCRVQHAATRPRMPGQVDLVCLYRSVAVTLCISTCLRCVNSESWFAVPSHVRIAQSRSVSHDA